MNFWHYALIAAVIVLQGWQIDRAIDRIEILEAIVLTLPTTD